MLYHSVVMVLTGLIAPSLLGEPSWMRDYDKARDQAERVGKPLAVVIASGSHGWERVTEEGRLSKDARQLLADHYVCLYVDTEHIRGRHLASDFEMREDVGLVLSDRSGRLQAFRHDGELPNDRLEQELRRYADPSRVVRQTESAERYSRYYSGEYEASAPVMQSAPAFFPSFVGGGGRGC